MIRASHMKNTVKVEKEKFESVLRKMLNTKPTPKADLPKGKKKLWRIIELVR